MEDSFERTSLFPTTLLVPGMPAGCPLLSRWSGVQQLVVYGRGEEGAGLGAGLCQVSWNSAQWNSTTRRLVNQSHGFFMMLRAQARARAVQAADVLHFSRWYRSALHECVLSLRAEGRRRQAAGPVSVESSQYQQQADVFAIMAVVWHLCEILFIEILPAGCLVQQLIEWVCWHGREREGACLQEVLSHLPPEGHEHYWRMLYRLVLTGRLSEAHNLLTQHSAAASMERLFISLDELLRKAPMVRSMSSLSRAELQHLWQQWRRECLARKDGGDFIAIPQLHLLARVLCGEEEVFKDPDVVGSCDHWYELMVGRLLFTSPLVISTDFDLVCTAEASLQAFPQTVGGHGSTPLDSLLLAALRHDALEVVSLASSELSNWWLAAHLADLLNHKEALSSQPEYGSKLSEFLVLEYASSLLTHQSLWQVAMDYLSECPTHGRHHMALHIERVPLTSERKATKVLHLCQQFQLRDQAQSVCRVLAMREFRSGRLGVALSWCLRAKDSIFAAFLAEKYFESYQTLGEFMDLDLLDYLGSAMLLSEKLTFLGKYREFHLLYCERKFRAAGELLVSLLHSNIVPRRFWLTLLTDALPLLDLPDQIVFTAEHTMTLAHCLQQLTSKSRIDQSYSTSKSHDSAERSQDLLVTHGNKISLLRLALCRNLARATLEDSEQS